MFQGSHFFGSTTYSLSMIYTVDLKELAYIASTLSFCANSNIFIYTTKSSCVELIRGIDNRLSQLAFMFVEHYKILKSNMTMNFYYCYRF